VKELIGGAIVASLVVVSVVVVLFRRRARQGHVLRREAPKVDAELTRLAGELAHEIKNPLSTLKVNLQLAKEALDDVHAKDTHSALSDQERHQLARALRKITIVQKETERLEQILEGFLRYVRQPDLQLAVMDLNQLVDDMIDFYSPQATSHKLTVRRGLCKKPLLCRVDPGALKQVLLNLFINAQQAMERGGELMVRTNRQANRAVIQINDTGTGIPPEKLPAIFRPYYSSRSDGTGLGLAAAKKIIEAHDGTISVHSDLGKGTSFIVEVPLAEATAPTHEEADA
jgi:signal transduction histidine kinase